MSDDKSSSSSSDGIGVFGLLGVIFICAKVFGVQPVADWSWWWVTAPLWVGFALLAVIFLPLFIFLWLTK
jgi:hypothetical protein